MSSKKKLRPFIVRLRDDQISAIARAAAECGCSQAAIARAGVDSILEQVAKQAAERQAEAMKAVGRMLKEHKKRSQP